MTGINDTSRLRFGPYEADLHTHELWKHGVRIKLVGQPFEILAVLIRRPGELVTREELRAQLWPGDTFVDFDHGLNAAVNKLRDALCDSAEDPKYIETLPRRGYRFVAAVEKAAEKARTPATPVPEATSAANHASAHEIVSHAPGSPEAPTHRNERDVRDTRDGRETAIFPTLETVGAQPKRRLSRRWRIALLCGAAIAVLWVLVNIGILDIIRQNHGWNEKRSAELIGAATASPLTDLSDATRDPAFSPDGTRVAFRRESFVPRMAGLYVKQVDGPELQQLTNDANDRFPVWSPDGKWIAFSRLSRKERTIFKVPAQGGDLRPLLSTPPNAEPIELDWSPDGKTIAFVGRITGDRTAISVLSLDSLAVRTLTMPGSTEDDWGPRYSPDGERLAFVRGKAGVESIVVMPSAGGEVRRVASELRRVNGAPAWSEDSQSIIFSGDTLDSSGLFRVSANGGASSLVPEIRGTILDPVVSNCGFHLAFVQETTERGIHQLDLYPPGQNARPLIETTTGNNAGAQFSPDRTKLVFGSTRTGGSEIWISDREGKNAIQLTSVNTAGTPRWSPDGKLIAFDVGQGDWDRPHAIFAIRAEGGSPQPIVQDEFDNPVPSFSRSGEWIYFPSNRSGDWQVWKIRVAGGNPVQVTTAGGFAAWEAPDHNLYYAKHRYPEPELWRVPIAGGTEAPVYPPVRPMDWAAWAVVDQGILAVEAGPNDTAVLNFLDFYTLGKRKLAVFENPPFWLGVSPDGKSIVFDQPGDQHSHIMLQGNFK
jgi:Tol biopolymer transport system component/DNA-binding winged helix-turn-helix (wHTH) protein